MANRGPRTEAQAGEISSAGATLVEGAAAGERGAGDAEEVGSRGIDLVAGGARGRESAVHGDHLSPIGKHLFPIRNKSSRATKTYSLPGYLLPYQRSIPRQNEELMG